jgi:hypothetical protein
MKTEVESRPDRWGDEETRPLPGQAVTGHLDGVDDEGRLLFREEGSQERVPVSIGIAASDKELVQAAWLGRRALVLHTADPAARHVLVSLVRERVSLDESVHSWLELNGTNVLSRSRGPNRIKGATVELN